jgi:HemY protein
MIKALWYITLLALLSITATLVADNPGVVSLEWLGYRVNTNIGVLLTAILVAACLLSIIFRVWFFIKNSPNRFSRERQKWRQKRGYKALTQGMVAVAAGDAQEARRQARKAEYLLAEPPLTMLLSAQAAQLSGDKKAASEFFVKMSERKDTKYLGIHGMLNQAIQEGDKDGALKLAKRANNLNPKTDKVFQALFKLQIEGRSWEEAEETVKKAVKDKHLSSDIGRRWRAVILYKKSVEAEESGHLNDALRFVSKANNLVLGFVPGAARTARLLQGAGRRRKAVSIIEEIWVTSPHPQLAEIMEELSSGVGAQEKMRALEKLAEYNKSHEESHLAIAKSALNAGMWQEAREHLKEVLDAQNEALPPARVCRYMAELEEGEKHDIEASREWLKKAAVAEPDSAWNCRDCGQIIAIWDALCSHCGGFDTWEWRTPPRIMRLAPENRGDSITNEKLGENTDAISANANNFSSSKSP